MCLIVWVVFAWIVCLCGLRTMRDHACVFSHSVSLDNYCFSYGTEQESAVAHGPPECVQGRCIICSYAYITTCHRIGPSVP